MKRFELYLSRFLVIACLLPASHADGITIRYAAVIGNDVGTDPEAGELPPLLHAEREAKALHAKLIECCNFDAQENRTLLLLRPTRADIKNAFEKIRAQVAFDRKTYGEIETMFAFFFTGHGLNGRIVLSDGPVGKEDLSDLFRSVNADLTVGVFDACYSASLDGGALAAKGFKPTPGINLFQNLPEEVLSARGSVWFVSSGPEELSYEDSKLGGIFTHFLIEALEHAEAQGPGISLDQIWSYARSKTHAYAAARSRAQNPQRIVSKMTERASIYFSFPQRRSASLTLGKDVEGTFMLTYANGQLAERIVKRAGLEGEIAVYAGSAKLISIENGRSGSQQAIEFQPGAKVVLATVGSPSPPASFGQGVQTLWAKGFGEQMLEANLVEPRFSIFAGPDYALSRSARGRLLPEHALGLLVRADRDMFVGEARAAYALGGERHASWGYETRTALFEGLAGIGLNMGNARFSFLAGVGGGHLRQTYEDGEKRSAWLFMPKGSLGIAYRITDPIAIRGDVNGGAMWGPGSGMRSRAGWSPVAGGSLSLLLRIH